MDIDRPPNLRTPGTEPGSATTPGGGSLGGSPPPINALAELVADLIAATGLVPADKLAGVRSAAGMGSFAHALVEQNVASSEGLARTLSARYQMPLVDLALTGVADEASGEIALHVLERLAAVPYAIEDGTLRIAIADPGNIQGIDELRLATRYPLELGVAARDDILVELRRLSRASEAFGARAAVEEELELEVEEEEEVDDLEVDDGISDAPLVRLVNSVIFQAAEDGASDIHFEPLEDALLVRFRVDGVLHEVQRIPKRMAPGVTTRLKVLAKLDIAERRKPQDGRISLNAAAAGRTLDIRLATLPTVEGESIVMRLLDKSKKAPTLQELGMSDEMRTALEELIRKPTGALLVTGPTGSGKSTTLYAALTEINRPEINIITVEDPVEYRLSGVNQVQINQKAGLTFATALRSILRSDPDVVMVGEIRDGETAKISIEAALTGHLVLSTLHTNSAAESIVRLLELGMDPFNFADALLGVLAQRLARRLCDCKEAYTPSHEELRSFVSEYALDLQNTPAWRADPGGEAQKLYEAWVEGHGHDGALRLYRAVGCARCNQTGYKGRVGLHELLVADDEIKRLIQERARVAELFAAAVGAGMRTLKMDGMEKILMGLTDLKQVRSVCIR
jgi:type II secretory ATPase GspE/PulE/Tfp pilus assembly ATPase PilB-like protein